MKKCMGGFFVTWFIFFCGNAYAQVPDLLIGKWKGYRSEQKDGRDTMYGGEKYDLKLKWEFDKTYYIQYQNDGYWTKMEFQVKDNIISYLQTQRFKIEKLTETDLIVLEIQTYPMRHYLKRVDNFDH